MYFFFHFHIRDATRRRARDERERASSREWGKKHNNTRTRDAFGSFTSRERAFDIRFGTIGFFSSHAFRGREALTFFFRIFSEPKKTLLRYALENDLLGNLPGKTPEATMASACYTDLKKKDVNKRVFARPSEGHFGLREWANDPELAHLLQPKLHRLAETFCEEKVEPKVEKPWKQPPPVVKNVGNRRNNQKKEKVLSANYKGSAKKYIDGKPYRDRHGFVHAMYEPSRGDYGRPAATQQFGSLSTHDRMDLDALVDAAADQEDEKEEDEDAYDRGDDYDDEEPNALNHTDSGADGARGNDDIDGANPGVEEDTDAEEDIMPLDLTNPDPNLSNDEYKARLTNLVQQQQEKDARVAKRKEREREKMRTEELVKAGLIPPPQPFKKKTSYVPVKYKRDGRGRPRKHFDELPPAELPPAPILSASGDELAEAPLTNNKRARFTSTAVLHQQQLQQQRQGTQQVSSNEQPRHGHDSFEVDTQGVHDASYEEIANERIIAKATRAGMKDWNSKVNKFYSTAYFTEVIDPKLPTSIPAFAFKMSQNDAEREKILTQNAMRRVFNEFAEGCDPVKQSLNELSASLERLRAQQGNHENVMYSALVYAVACYRSEYPEEATLALSKAWEVYFSLKGGNETKTQDGAFMDKIRKDFEKIVSEALGA